MGLEGARVVLAQDELGTRQESVRDGRQRAGDLAGQRHRLGCVAGGLETQGDGLEDLLDDEDGEVRLAAQADEAVGGRQGLQRLGEPAGRLADGGIAGVELAQLQQLFVRGPLDGVDEDPHSRLRVLGRGHAVELQGGVGLTHLGDKDIELEPEQLRVPAPCRGLGAGRRPGGQQEGGRPADQ